MAAALRERAADFDHLAAWIVQFRRQARRELRGGPGSWPPLSGPGLQGGFIWQRFASLTRDISEKLVEAINRGYPIPEAIRRCFLDGFFQDWGSRNVILRCPVETLLAICLRWRFSVSLDGNNRLQAIAIRYAPDGPPIIHFGIEHGLELLTTLRGRPIKTSSGRNRRFMSVPELIPFECIILDEGYRYFLPRRRHCQQAARLCREVADRLFPQVAAPAVTPSPATQATHPNPRLLSDKESRREWVRRRYKELEEETGYGGEKVYRKRREIIEKLAEESNLSKSTIRADVEHLARLGGLSKLRPRRGPTHSLDEQRDSIGARRPADLIG